MAPIITVEACTIAGMSELQATAFCSFVSQHEALSPAAAWLAIQERMVAEAIPFSIQESVFFELNGRAEQPLAAWVPTSQDIEHANLSGLWQACGFKSYAELYQWSIEDRDAFWQKALDVLAIQFAKKPRAIMDMSKGVAHIQWFPGAQLNIAASCFQADPQAPAIVLRRRAEAALETLSYGELNALSNRFAAALVRDGFQPGDTVAIDMPMTAEAVIAYLGTVKSGCAVISIADSFTPEEIAKRLRIGNAKAMVTMDVSPRGGKRLPMYEKVQAADAPRAIVVTCDDTLAVPLRQGDVTWDAFLDDDDTFTAIPRPPHAVSNILFSSGTTGDPKAIPWTHTTPIRCGLDAHFHHDIHAGDVVAWPTNLGWMMGPFLIYAALLNRATIALYYDAPTGCDFAAFVADAKVNMLGVVPSIVRAWRAANATDGLDWSAIRAFSSTGECSNARDMFWLMAQANYRPVVEYCGGTEIGGGYLTQTLVQPAVPAAFSTPALGTELLILDDEAQPAEEGEVFLVPPSIGWSTELLNKDHFQTYYANTPTDAQGRVLRRHGDQLKRVHNACFRALGRADDTMNLGGIKVGSAELERAVKTVAGVIEAAAIAVTPAGGGPSELLMVTVTDAPSDRASLLRAMQQAIRTHLNPLFKICDVLVVAALPRTASGKVMRRVLRDQYDRQQGNE